MKNTMEYKGYVGNVEFSEEDEVFFGKVIGIRSLISYEGATAKDLRMYDGYDYMSIMKTAITYSHGIVIASPNVNPELVAYAKENKRHVIDYAPKEEQFPVINKLYDTLIGSNINN